MTIEEQSLKLHYELKGKIETAARVGAKTREQLSLAYTPGVAAPCLVIKDDKSKSFELTRRANTVAVITDGTAVLGLGDIGPEAAMPVMEGKALLFKEFANIDAIPLCLRTKDPNEIVKIVSSLCGSFGGINLEDISSPRCFEIERRLKEICDIPVFHDDQHGTAVVVSAAVLNASRVVKKPVSSLTVTICGAGAAGTAIGAMLKNLGVYDIIYYSIDGIMSPETEGLDDERKRVFAGSNKHNRKGGLREAMAGADVFVGVSAGGIVNGDMIRGMAKDPLVFAMANPKPEIMPDEAKKAGAAVVGTGRSDYPNQINNVLAFPGIFRGALDCRANQITEKMKVAAAYAIANLVSQDELCADYILPNAFDERICPAVAKAVAQAYGE